ncbi:DoxX family protein [Hyalangium rubrum]|uniref:DoxX family protein n=1 Tax=Hyalangium rubrum TaxID=3103134 RepID=A0ABU5GZN9_9BACT|nr:DoxX family protein [Hyalangium sp. s54d21]MDY7226511.1 DoxX family protein [Hyalangium sp. s54d21]
MSNAAAPTFTSAQRPSRGLHIGLWVSQVLLALVFAMAGLTKLITPAAELAKATGAIVPPVELVRFIGVSEIAGTLGLILPSLTRIRPGLTPLAAAALTVVMVLAAGYHLIRGEFSSVPANVIIGALAVFVAWGRFKKAPITPRG